MFVCIYVVVCMCIYIFCMQGNRVLQVRGIGHIPSPDERIVPYLRAVGFYGISRIRRMMVDWALISALVERWRPETHTFHTTQGEMTITLQDVEIQIGLPVDGHAVTGLTKMNWIDVCQQLLGDVPPLEERFLNGQRLSLTWLAMRYADIPDAAPAETIECYARAYILRLIGSILCQDKSTHYVHLMFLPLLANLQEAGSYSWGLAILAWTYRELCNATKPDRNYISGCMLLVQMWAWDRFPSIAPVRRVWLQFNLEDPPPLSYRWTDAYDTIEHPSHVINSYRNALDCLKPNQVP